MAAELMLINPRRRKRTTKARRNPRRRRKMTALQAKYFAPRRRRRRRAAATTIVRRNPVRRRRHHYRRRIHVRRNPMPSMRGVGATLTGAAIGAGGAIGLGYLWKTLAPNLPASLQSGMTATVAQGAAAVGLGWAASKALGRNVGQGIAVGALTVILYNLASSYMSGGAMAAGAPGTALTGGGGGYNPAINYSAIAAQNYHFGNYPGLAGLGRRGMHRYVGMKGMNRYVGMKGLAMRRARLRGLAGMGYINPARTFANVGGRPQFRKA